MNLKRLIRFFFTVLKRIINVIVREFFAVLYVIANRGFPTYLITYEGGLGDDLLCTTVANELLKKNNNSKIWIATKYPELYRGNPSISFIIKKGSVQVDWSRILRHKRLFLAYTTPVIGRQFAEDESPSEHILEILCHQAGIIQEIKKKTYFFLNDDEKKQGKIYPKQIALQCIGPSSGTLMANKLWFQERFQEVVDAINRLYLDVKIIQVGSLSDPLLDGVHDLRGLKIRDTASILFNSLCFIGTVGFLMHLANSVSCRSVIIYGGREHSWQSGYSENFNIESTIQCAPCWKWNYCEYDRQCMKEISSREVYSKTLELVRERYG